MVLLHVPPIRTSEVVEVNGVVNPLFNHIALTDAGQQHGRCVSGKDEADGRGDREERKQVFQFGVDVLAVKRALVMFPVERVQVLIGPALVDFPTMLRDLKRR
jgi:hypothetical protein